jgi:hypothetical protein
LDATPTGIVGTAIDIAIRKQGEQDLRQALREKGALLQRLQRAMTKCPNPPG